MPTDVPCVPIIYLKTVRGKPEATYFGHLLGPYHNNTYFENLRNQIFALCAHAPYLLR